jgi:diadenosine tetraphosphate (Ap4A) HIT family hydrolase
MPDSCEYCQLKEGYGNKIIDTPLWMIFLAPSQRYLGTCVIALKRSCEDLSEVNQEEWTDFAMIVRKMEETWRELFHPTLFNWSCYKNSAFRADNPKPEIHWHFIPRYKEELLFGGQKFKDPDFGYIPQPITHKLPAEIQNKLLEEIKTRLKI